MDLEAILVLPSLMPCFHDSSKVRHKKHPWEETKVKAINLSCVTAGFKLHLSEVTSIFEDIDRLARYVWRVKKGCVSRVETYLPSDGCISNFGVTFHFSTDFFADT